MTPHYYRDELGNWICSSCDSHYLYVGISRDKAEAYARWEETRRSVGR